MLWFGLEWCGLVQLCMDWFGQIFHGLVWYGFVLFFIWFCFVWYGLVWYGMVQLGIEWPKPNQNGRLRARRSEYIVFSGLFLGRLSSVGANFLYEVNICDSKHTPKKLAVSADFRLKAVGVEIRKFHLVSTKNTSLVITFVS